MTRGDLLHAFVELRLKARIHFQHKKNWKPKAKLIKKWHQEQLCVRTPGLKLIWISLKIWKKRWLSTATIHPNWVREDLWCKVVENIPKTGRRMFKQTWASDCCLNSFNKNNKARLWILTSRWENRVHIFRKITLCLQIMGKQRVRVWILSAGAVQLNK